MTPFAGAPSLAVRLLGEGEDPQLTRSYRHARQRAHARRRAKAAHDPTASGTHAGDPDPYLG